ncbi:hypothetical protein TPB0596_04420 [Tsukamurella pulmonis]|uniref:hypothetical protein n=1 Tax=Tsukamurella pulmonis TaxID=47312 RepID=UPI001EDDEBD0|nr:hypothetical protein [Tsukamurella pulmonis]BDD80679.1 hypothetical protein TPB0596_04420 [Tsukamurella pulmonis]
MTRVDQVENHRYDFTTAGIGLEVMTDSREQVPSLLQFDTADLDAVLERVLASGFSVRTWPREGQTENAVVEIGDLTVAIVRRAGPKRDGHRGPRTADLTVSNWVVYALAGGWDRIDDTELDR